MKKLFYVVAFVSSATLGAACNSELKDACNDFVDTRNACEALTPPDPDNLQKYSINLCDNVDPECQAFYECAASAPCNEDSKDKFRLDLNGPEGLNQMLKDEAKANGTEYVECKEPENKACTDADLRP